MRKMISALSVLLFSMAANAQLDKSVEATLKRVEFENAAVCVYEKTSLGLAVNLYRWSKRQYVCDGNDGLFRLTLRVREEGFPNRFGQVVYKNGVVTKIKYKNY